MVELLRKKPMKLTRVRVKKDKNTNAPPLGTPDWCLNEGALVKFHRFTDNIPVYDYDSDEEVQDEVDDTQDVENDNNSCNNSDNSDDSKAKNSHKKKKSLKKQKKRKKNHKSKKTRK